MELSIILPSFLEEENLKMILPELNNVLNNKKINYEILVVDTQQPMDGTKTVCEENNAIYINRKNGNLYGDAIRTGLSFAKGSNIIIMDADGSHDTKDVLRLFEEIKKTNADIVVGSRYCKGGNTDNGLILVAMSWCLNLTYRVLFGFRIKDVSNSFRIYKAEQLKKITLECDNFDIVEEILIKLKMKYGNIFIKEIPITFKKRNKGESKRDLVKFIFSYLKTIKRLMDIRNKK